MATRAARLAAVALTAALLTACSGPPGHTGATSTPADVAPVTVVAGKATTLNLGGGADLIIPPGAVQAGAKVSARYEGKPGGSWRGITPTSAPVQLISDPPDAIHGLLTLEFPVPVSRLAASSDPANAFGIATYDGSTKTWTPYPSSYDPARHMVVALIPHFSWWNPFTWNFDQIWADVAQGFGQVVGSRSGPAHCTGSPPSWVNQLVGLTNSADIAIHACAQAQGSVLDVEMVNNRPYGQVLTYGSGVKWGWHETGGSAADVMRDALMDGVMRSNQLYIPPLGAASVGILQPRSGSYTSWHIGPTTGSIGADLFFYLAGKVISAKVPMGKCVAADLDAKLTDMSPGALRDDMLAVADCAKNSFLAAVAAGQLDQVPVQQLSAEMANIGKASLLATGIELAGGVTWKLSDLVADWYVAKGSQLGNGFGVLAKAAPYSPPAGSGGGSPPGGSPAPPPPGGNPPPPGPVDAYSNYGPANAGHAMCRGNPGNPQSMPGGTASQTFTVPTGVASLSAALIQIDPDSTVTAHLTVYVDGTPEAAASATAAGDTHFSFGPVGVRPGDSVTLALTFTASYGKIITVYTAGAPGGTFTASNSCPDGAPSLSTTATGLRAVVSGTS